MRILARDRLQKELNIRYEASFLPVYTFIEANFSHQSAFYDTSSGRDCVKSLQLRPHGSCERYRACASVLHEFHLATPRILRKVTITASVLCPACNTPGLISEKAEHDPWIN